MIAKRCPICGGKPQVINYCVPKCISEMGLLLKRLECKECGATVPQLDMTLDDAVKCWNAINKATGERYVWKKAATEGCMVEGETCVIVPIQKENTFFPILEEPIREDEPIGEFVSGHGVERDKIILSNQFVEKMLENDPLLRERIVKRLGMALVEAIEGAKKND